jgi:hypothetical protein
MVCRASDGGRSYDSEGTSEGRPANEKAFGHWLTEKLALFRYGSAPGFIWLRLPTKHSRLASLFMPLRGWMTDLHDISWFAIALARAAANPRMADGVQYRMSG